ncbi:hypothetical protein UCRPA7_8246 [Phaeoacremonium minimum UCRPA7]|uniref:Uncharacterized protein n=1 Tax=Phaeoacremonium minimum (strain UCR-PA7) TaxID=1286976 RepID=R8BAF4_PHAM7|nr:hypothetical protein UCRPA7_8246 [Phaeoacremonium minimum UCRPA7]EON96252.1 hypothetical protein UCRPA7_8246 [Phaeoacremonium minimum UCRPA7]
MPKQHVLFGRPVPRLSSRRLSVLLAGLSIFAVFTLLFTVPSSIPGPRLSVSDHKFSIPKWKSLPVWHPFKAPSHPPPRQTNDTYGESSWYSNWRWLSIPFSSTITLDEDRLLLPMVRERPPIYCYYDTTIQRDEASKDAESEILLTWRRAWWAQGFKPVILSAAEAMNNPVYEELQRMDLENSLKTDLMKWLAWENMGGGLLAHYLLFPMGSHEDPLLAYLRRGEYPSLTRWNKLGDGLFAGSKREIADAIKLVMSGPDVRNVKDFLSALPSEKDRDPFKLDDKPEALAFYDARTLEQTYTKVADVITGNRAEGLKRLNQLINSHLHLTWQNLFSDGIAVLKPLPHHTTTMIQNAVELANNLQQCTESPMQSSCPPNRPKCAPCVASTPMKIASPSRYHNTSTLYTIGTVPHPYTFQSVTKLKENIDIPWIRRDSVRDLYVTEITKDILGTGMSGGPRVLRFKEAVAGEYATAHSLWFVAERDLPDDLDWHFGFEIPKVALDQGKSETPVPGPERRPQPFHDPKDGPVPNPDELKREPPLLERAKEFGRSKKKEDVAVRNAMEAWNLADTEAWKFTRAFRARSRVERIKWEEEESKYAGGAGTEKDRRTVGWGRWLDRNDD